MSNHNWIQLARLLSLLLLLATIGSHTASGQPLSQACPNKFDITKKSKTLQALYCATSNVDLSSSANDEKITHAIFVVHGLPRNAGDYIDYLESALALTGQEEDETLAIIAPQFITDQDISEQDSDLLYWSYLGWIKGNISQKDPYDRPFTISSFAVADLMIQTAVDTYPNLAKITVFGFSAGGQWVHRYAAGGKHAGSDQIQVQYIVSSPSSYLYFSKKRPSPNSLEQFSVPDEAECPDYNDYTYGLEGLNTYMADNGASTLKSKYKSRDVVILLGDEDTTRDGILDDRCAADLQGYNRLDRGLAFWNNAMQYFGDKLRSRHKLKVAPGIGHTAEDMLQSDCALLLLFDYDTDACPDYTFSNDISTSAVDSDTAAKTENVENYQQLALNYWTLVFDMVRADKGDAEDWYLDRIAPLQSTGIQWQIRDGSDSTEYSGTRAVKNFLVESRKTIESLFALNDDPQRLYWSTIHRSGGEILVTASYRDDQDDTALQATVNFKTQGSRQGLITEVVIVVDP